MKSTGNHVRKTKTCHRAVCLWLFCYLLLGVGQGWAKEVVVLFTGNTQGFLEVCGCSENQLGGVARRAALVRDLRHKHPNTMLVDAGGMFAGDTPLDQLRCAVHLDAMAAMKYDVAHLDVSAFQFGKTFVKAMRDTAGLHFVNGNVSVAGDGVVPSFRVVARGGVSIGFVGVGDSMRPRARSMMGEAVMTKGAVDIQVSDAIKAVERAILEMGDVDAVMVLSDLDREAELALIQAVEKVAVVIGTRTLETVEQVGTALRLGTQLQGKALGHAVLELEDHHVVNHRVTSVFVTETIGEDPAVKKLVDGFYTRVAQRPGLQMAGTPRFVGYDLEKQVTVGRNAYLGEEACSDCHAKEYADWKATPHARAFRSLLQQQKHVQPGCVPCHTTGFGFETGFKIGADHKSRTNVQCEVCHGPGGQHARRPEKRNIRRVPPADLCQQCHDQDQTPFFDKHYPEMLAEITHHGQGQGQDKQVLSKVLESGLNGPPLVELFVMADCPYGKRAENALGPMLQKMGDQIDLKVYFIADEVGVDDVSVPSAASRGAPGCSGTATGTGRFRSLHGDAEVEEGIRQLVIQKLYPDKMWDYILTRNAETSAWRDCALKLGMDVVEIEKMAAGETGASLFSDNIRRANLLGIHASPTLRVNGQEVEAFFDPTALALAICKADSGVVLCADMPVCRHDADCAASGKIGICVDANTPQAKCEEYPTVSFGVQVLNDSTCSVCETYPFVRSTLALFPGAKFETVEVHSDAGRLLKNRYGLDRVPSFVLDADFARAARFDRFQHTVVRVGDAFVPDVRMTAVARILTENEARGIDTFIDLAHPAAVGLAERLVGWVQDVKQMDRLRLHFVGEAEGDRLFRQAFLLDARRAYDALLVYARHQRQRRPDFLVAMCLEKVGFSLAGLRAAKDGARTQHIDTMHALGGQRDMVPFVVLDSQVVVSGVGLARLEAVFYQMHPELAEKDRNVRRP